jgi:hypothetical protein
MGCKNSKILYETACKKDKENISDDFKKIYSNKSISEIRVFEEVEKSKFYIELNGYNIYFNREIEIIDFISQLERPFILDDNGDRYYVRFIHTLN